MINFPLIWIIFPIVLTIIIVISWLLTKRDKLENKVLRSGFVIIGAIIGFLAFILPFFEQPKFQDIILNYVIGILLTVFGLIARVYPMIYLRRKGTTTALSKVTEIIDTGPYGIIRHPQYSGRILLIIGWYLIWGSIFCLCLVPLIALLTVIQALIEEKYILEKKFGNAYFEYKKRVGMFIPKRRKH